MTPKMSRSVRTPSSCPAASVDDDRIAGPGGLDQAEALAERRALGDGQRVAPVDDPERLPGKRGDAVGDGAFGQLSHAPKCSPFRSGRCPGPTVAPARPSSRRDARRPADAPLLGSAGGSPAARRGRARARLGGLVRVGGAVRQAGLRHRRRLADAARLAVPHRGRAVVGLAGAVSAARRAGLLRLSRRRVLVALGLGVLYLGNSGTYYAGLETVSASLAALIVFIYPAHRRGAVAAGRAPARRPAAVGRPGDGAGRDGPRARRHPGGARSHR